MPKLITTPFAVNGQKNEITVNTPESDNSATYDIGFPPVTSLPIASGGKPPKGADFNGLFYDITDNISYLTLGNGYVFNTGLSYPLNARINRTDGVRVRSTVASNTTNPNTSMIGWEVDSLSPGQNLLELTDKAAARTNLGVYSKSETDAKLVGDEILYIPIPYPKSTPPTGYLAMMGQTISQATYPKLYGLYGATLPDLRAYTIRGLDNGRGVDVDRVVLSEQEDAIRNITGDFSSNTSVDGIAATANGAFQVSGENGRREGASASGPNKSTVSFDASLVVPTADENRVKNIAFLYIVKAG